MLLVRTHLRFHDAESIKVENGGQRGPNIALGRVPRDSSGSPRSAGGPRGRRGQQPNGCDCAGLDRECHALSGGPDAHRWRATSGGRWSGSRRTNGCPPRRRRPIPPCFLSESLNERAKWIARGIEDAIPTQRVVETTPARASEVQRGDAVKMAAKKTPAVRCVIGSVLP